MGLALLVTVGLIAVRMARPGAFPALDRHLQKFKGWLGLALLHDNLGALGRHSIFGPIKASPLLRYSSLMIVRTLQRSELIWSSLHSTDVI